MPNNKSKGPYKTFEEARKAIWEKAEELSLTPYNLWRFDHRPLKRKIAVVFRVAEREVKMSTEYQDLVDQ